MNIKSSKVTNGGWVSWKGLSKTPKTRWSEA